MRSQASACCFCCLSGFSGPGPLSLSLCVCVCNYLSLVIMTGYKHRVGVLTKAGRESKTKSVCNREREIRECLSGSAMLFCLCPRDMVVDPPPNSTAAREPQCSTKGGTGGGVGSIDYQTETCCGTAIS